MASKTERLVPWISMEEWKRVYKQVYSEERNEKWAGLNQMIMWKSRVTKLSLGIECSLYLLQSILRDEEYQVDPNSTLSQNDITLMYSTAIIRFINLISHLGQVDLRHQPISAIAEMAGIPDWVVSIRHEATHAKMPSLDILRPGASLAMEWLKENYWRTEEEHSFDLYWPESKEVTSEMMALAKTQQAEEQEMTSSTLKCAAIPKILQQAVSMLILLIKEMGSRNSINEMQCPELHEYLYKLWQQNKKFATPLNKKEIANLTLPLKKLLPLVFDDVKRLLSERKEISGTEEMVGTEENETMHEAQCFISAFCQSPYLLARPGKGTIFNNLNPIWNWISQWKIAPCLMNDLVHTKIEHKKRKAHLNLISDLANALLQAQANPENKKNIFKFDENWHSTDWEKMTLSLLQEPHQDTWKAVSKLFHLHNPPVDAVKQEKVATLLRLYLDSKMSAKPSDQSKFGKPTKHSKIYTLDMLNVKNEKPQVQEDLYDRRPQNDKSLSDQVAVIDTWTLCSEHDWFRIPIGSLPENRIENLEFEGVEWELIEAESDHSDRLVNDAKRTGERFDWNSLMRKRRRRGGHTKEGPTGLSWATG